MMQQSKLTKEYLIMQRAQKAVLARDYQTAINLYVKLLKAAPNNIDVLTKLGSVYVSYGDDATALKFYTTVIQNDPSNFKALNSLSGIYRRLGKFDESIAVINKLKEIGDNPDEMEYDAGYTYKLMGKYDKAAACFRKAIEKNPNDVLAYNHLGTIEDLCGNSDKALAAFSCGLQIDPNHPILHYNTAMHLSAHNKTDKAAEHFEAALRAKPGWTDALNQYSDLLLKSGDNRRAEDLLLKNINLNPENMSAYNKLGKLYGKHGDFEKAEKVYLQALEIDAENMSALSGLGRIYDKQKKYFDAASIMERLGKLRADDIHTSLRYTKILIELHRLRDAAVLLKKLYTDNETNPEILNIAAQYFIRSNDFKKTYICCRRIQRFNPEEYEFFRDNALQFMRMSAFKNAEQFFKAYLKRNPENAEVWAELAGCYEKLGQYKKAFFAVQHCLKADNNNFAGIELLERLSRYLNRDSEAAEVITDLLNNSIHTEGSLDTLLSSLETRENILNIIEPPAVDAVETAFFTEDDANDGDADGKTPEIESLEADGIEDEVLQLDIPPSNENREDDCIPFCLTELPDDFPEQIGTEEIFNFSDLLAPDTPLEYAAGNGEASPDDFFDIPYSQNYDLSEDERIVSVSGTDFKDEHRVQEVQDLPPVQELSAPLQKNVPGFPPPLSAAAPSVPVYAPLPQMPPPTPYTPSVQAPAQPHERPEQHITQSSPLPAAQTLFAQPPPMPIEPPHITGTMKILQTSAAYAQNADSEQVSGYTAPLSNGGQTAIPIVQHSENIYGQSGSGYDEKLIRRLKSVPQQASGTVPADGFSHTVEVYDLLQNFLSKPEKEKLLSDVNRVKLDYVIKRLESKPGLLSAAQALHASGIVAPPVPYTKEHTEQSLAHINSLSRLSADKGRAAVLYEQIEKIIANLHK